MNRVMKNLGTYLRAARQRKELSLRAVEEATGISNAYLSQLESSKIQQPSPTVLYKLSELYEISYADVMELAGYPVPNRPDSNAERSSFAARLGPITRDEEESLIDYLAFLRSKHNRRGRT